MLSLQRNVVIILVLLVCRIFLSFFLAIMLSLFCFLIYKRYTIIFEVRFVFSLKFLVDICVYLY